MWRGSGRCWSLQLVPLLLCALLGWQDVASGAHLRTGILVHGCHLQAEGWERIVWGDEKKQLLGRIPQAVLMAHTEEAELIVFGTGGSETAAGVKEGEYTMAFMFDNFERLRCFEALANIDLKKLEKRMRTCSIVESQSQNTAEELQRCGVILNGAHIERVILVSSPTHIPRCLRDACGEFARQGYSFRRHLLAAASDTCYHNTTIHDVAIIEPPHRGDRDKALDETPLHRLIFLFWKESAWRKRAILEGLHDLIGPEKPLR
mmetsp:Transcript_13197/g.32038  ORF Transcript_13197/g.32038 Transcript_13197/m.32038 type:complete len:262 (-) Transcript_13197:261-1046(-)